MNIRCWLFFFIVALGLGYSAVFRYSPPAVGGLSDSANYFATAERGIGAVEEGHWRYRVLVPLLAKPLRSLLVNLTGRQESTAAAMLLVNAALIATTALVVCMLALSIGATPSTALLAAFIWLASFPVVNYGLAGMVDSVEALAIALVLLAGITRRWMIVVCVPLLALGKETAVPLATMAAGGFAVYAFTTRRQWQQAARWTVTIVVTGLIAVAAAHWLVDGSWRGVGALLREEHAQGDLLAAIWQALVNRGNLYVFLALLPAGLMARREIPASLWTAAGSAALTAFALATWNMAGSNTARPLFSALGPVLATGAAMWLSKQAATPVTR